jgi:hypothetical protein
MVSDRTKIPECRPEVLICTLITVQWRKNSGSTNEVEAVNITGKNDTVYHKMMEPIDEDD